MFGIETMGFHLSNFLDHGFLFIPHESIVKTMFFPKSTTIAAIPPMASIQQERVGGLTTTIYTKSTITEVSLLTADSTGKLDT